MKLVAVLVWLAAGLLLLPGIGEAGQDSTPAPPPLPAAMEDSETELPFAFDGPPPPVEPEVIRRDASGRATVRAVRLTSPLRLDGQLDEAVYTSVRPVSGFTQLEPSAGSPATERTELWLTFDHDHIYVSFRCWDSHPERMVVNEMRRDSRNIFQNEFVAFMLDTFYDRRNAAYFAVNPLGGRVDGQITNERQFNTDWNTVWDVRVGRFEGGWTVEAAIPFKSLRYRPGRKQIWGVNLERRVRWKNEVSFLSPIPIAFGFARAFMQLSYAATMVGLEVPAGSKNLEIKPYVTSNLRSDLAPTPQIANELGGDVGLDVKYGVTQNLTADFTYNTDFAQVEADEQQVNLTRFSLFFPEKREFFLENQGTFAFGGVQTRFGGGGDTPILFYSRRIGLDQGQVVPLEAGGRLTGRVGRFSLGVLQIRAADQPLSGIRATNFSVVRLKHDILRRSSVGVLYTGRSASQNGGQRNDGYGVDGTFTFFDNLIFNTYWARTHTPGLVDDDTSHRLQMDYGADRYGVRLERLVVGEHFSPEVGFVRRDDMRRHSGQLRFSPRPRGSQVVRRYFWTTSLVYIENGARQLETRDWDAGFAIEFHNSDRFNVTYNRTYEFLPQEFVIASGVTLPVGGYDYASVRTGYNFGRQRQASANVSVEHGTFYNGHKTTLSIRSGRLNLSPQLSVEPTVSVNRVDLVEGAFTTNLFGARVTYTMTPRMFVSTLVQYSSSSSTAATNVRLRWEYRPGSELFLVYNEQRDTLTRGFPQLANRALILKINRLFRF